MARIITICNAKGGVGKCVAPETPVLLASGELTRIDQVFEENLIGNNLAEIDEEGGIFIKPKKQIDIFALDQNLKFTKTSVSCLYRGKANKLRNVLTARGKEISVTLCHPFLVLRDGTPVWVRADELKLGDFVATPRVVPSQSVGTEVSLLEYMSEEVNVRVERDIIENLWCQIIQSSSNRSLSERIIARLVRSSATSTELRKLDDKNFVSITLGKLLKAGLITRLSSRKSFTYEYTVNQEALVEHIYDQGFSASAFKKLGLSPTEIKKLIYVNRFNHVCPAINPIIFLDEELARFLAIIIAEGSIGPSRIVFYNNSPSLIDCFITYCEKIGFSYSKKRLKNQWVVRVNGAGTLVKILQDVFSIPIRGLRKSSRVKVPDLILSASQEVLAAYLGAYIDSEGYVAKDRSTIEIVSASKENIIGLHYAFLRFGISSSIGLNQKWATNSPQPKKRTYYRLTITGARNLQVVKDKMFISIPEKAIRLKKICKLSHNTNNDIIPVAPILRQTRRQLGLPQRILGLQGTITDYEDGSSAPSRHALTKMVSVLQPYISSEFMSENQNLKMLARLSRSDLFWDQVKKIYSIDYNGYVYDLAVADYHNFIAGYGAFVVHNTTTSINLSAYLAAMGKYVLLVDMDSQANATGGLGISLNTESDNIYHAIVNDQNPLPMIKKTSIFGFDVLPAAQSLAGATVELVSMEEREFRLKNVLNSLRINYDYILVDCPPSLGLLTINALTAGDHVIIPVQCEYYALEGLGQLLHAINLIRQSLNPDLQVMGVLLTMYDKRNQLNRHVLNEVNKNFPGRVFETVISRTIDLAEAPSYGKPILQFNPYSKAANEYRRLAEEVIKLTS